MIQRAIIHVAGPPGAGKTSFVEHLLHGIDQEVLAARCRRDASRRHPREASPMTDRELRRYRAGAVGAAMFTFPFPADGVVADDLYMTRLMGRIRRRSSSRATAPLKRWTCGSTSARRSAPVRRCWCARCVIARRRRGTGPLRWSGCSANPMGSCGSSRSVTARRSCLD